jgi:2-C-methyl-D-erythritol 4-phosphate cytidylyltransferase
MIAALVAAAGSGARLARGEPKSLVQLAGRPMAAWSVAALARSRSVEQIVVAAPGGHEREVQTVVSEAAGEVPVVVVHGGESRSASVARALAAVEGATVVVVQDAARPLLTAELVDRCVAELEALGCDGVVAAARVSDTIKEASADGRVTATLEREALWAVQTPQVFLAGSLRLALAHGHLHGASDDAQLVEAIGGDVRLLEAGADNVKVTTPLDLRLAELLLAERVG